MLAKADRGPSLLRVAIGILVLGGVVLLLLVAFWGLVRRKMYGKWLGLPSLILLWLVVLYIQLARPSGPLKYYEYNSPAELVGAVMMGLFLSGLFLILILRLAFSKKVNRFFESTTTD